MPRCLQRGAPTHFDSMEVINHSQYGITDEDLGEAVLLQEEEPEIPGHYPISVHIEKIAYNS